MLRSSSFTAAAVSVLLVPLIGGSPACSASVDGNATTGATSTGSGGAGGGGGDSETVASSGGVGGGGGSGGAAPSCEPYSGVVLAIDELFVGGRTFAGQTTSDAWEEFGFDLDDSNTVADFAGHCLPVAGGTTAAFVDGPLGRDNSFGRNVLPVVNGLVPPLDGQANDAIQAGQFTQLFAFEGLGSEGDKDPVVTRLYGGANLGMAPAWDGTDCWPLLNETLADPTDLGSAVTSFATAKLSGNLWNSSETQDLVLTLNFLGQAIPIKIYAARLKVTLAPSHEGGALGQLGGYVKTEEFVQTLRSFAGILGKEACTIFDASLADKLRQASDIMDDGTQDPTKTCNAISVGMGFTLRKVGLAGVADPASPPADYCK